MTPEEQLDALRTEAAAFHAAVGDLDTPVPACPSWRVRDLVSHVGSVHRMFRRVADEGWMRRPPRLEVDDRPPVEDDAVAAWSRHETRALLTALERLDPTSPRWNFTDGPQVGAFVIRRMLHETTVHRWDLQTAYALPAPLPRDVAIDGVHEFLEVQLPRSGDWPGPHSRVRIVVDVKRLTDVHLVPGEQARVFLASDGRWPFDARLVGAAGDVYLSLWGRSPIMSFWDGPENLAALLRKFTRT